MKSQTDHNPPKNHPWRFSLRSLLVLITLVALVIATQSRFSASYEKQRRIASELTADFPDTHVSFRQTLPDWLPQYHPQWTLELYLIDVTGRRGRKNQSQTDVDYSDDDLNAQIERLIQLPGLKEFHASETRLTDASLSTIAKIPSIETVNVYNTAMTPQAVREVQAQNPEITVIYFDE